MIVLPVSPANVLSIPLNGFKILRITAKPENNHMTLSIPLNGFGGLPPIPEPIAGALSIPLNGFEVEGWSGWRPGGGSFNSIEWIPPASNHPTPSPPPFNSIEWIRDKDKLEVAKASYEAFQFH